MQSELSKPAGTKKKQPATVRIATWSAQLFNNRVDAAVTGTFLVLVVIVVLANARVWVQLLAGKRAPEMREEPYVALAATQR